MRFLSHSHQAAGKTTNSLNKYTTSNSNNAVRCCDLVCIFVGFVFVLGLLLYNVITCAFFSLFSPCITHAAAAVVVVWWPLVCRVFMQICQEPIIRSVSSEIENKRRNQVNRTTIHVWIQFTHAHKTNFLTLDKRKHLLLFCTHW